MENLCTRFPLVSKMVFNELDDQSLTKVKMSNRDICQNVEGERFYWIRVLKSFRGRIGELKNKLWKKIPNEAPAETIPQICKFNESWMKAVKKAPAEIIKQFAMACNIFFDYYAAGDWSPLHIAAGSGQLNLFKMTYDKTGKSNPWTSGLTPLHIAAGVGQLEICQLIMNDLDDKNPGNPVGYTPLHHAAHCGSLEGYKFIMDRLDGKNPLYYPEFFNLTPLYSAAFSGHLEVFRFILENGGTGDLDVILQAVAEYGFLNICILIMERLEDKNPRNSNGQTPFHFAAMFGRLKICKVFVKLLAEKNPRDNNGLTPLHLAAKYGFLEVCQLISSEIQDKNPVNDSGKTPLAYAIDENHQDVVDFLSS